MSPRRMVRPSRSSFARSAPHALQRQSVVRVWVFMVVCLRARGGREHGETFGGEGMGGARVGMGLDSGMGSPHPPGPSRSPRNCPDAKVVGDREAACYRR